MRQENYSSMLEIAANQKVKEKNYWLKKLSGELKKSSFPYDLKRADQNECCLDILKFIFKEDIFAGLMKLCNGSNYTLNTVLVAVLAVLLRKYTSNNDIMVGTPIYKQDIEGEFMNTVIVLRTQLVENMTFKELLLQERQVLFEAMENYNYPIEMLPDMLDTPLSENDEFPLFDVVILLENIQDKNHVRNIKSNILFSFLRTDGALEVKIEYNSSLYSKAMIERIAGHFENILHQVLQKIDLPVSMINILSGAERKKLLYDFNNTEAEFPGNKTIHELFEQQVEKTPDRISVIFEDRQLTYKELNEKSNRLARVLRKKGVETGTIIGIIVEHSIEMMEGILGILKAGGIYLPIDGETPQDRVISMLADCQSSFLLTKSGILTKYSFTALQKTGKTVAAPYLTPIRGQIKDLDNLPFADATLINYDKYSQYIGVAVAKHSISILATRGCPYRCAYCHRIWPNRHVVRSAEDILEEIKIYYEIGIRRFVFLDDVFNLNVKNSTAFFRLVIESGMKLQFFFTNGLRGDLLTKEYIDLMIEAGTVEIGLSLETASPRLQKLIGKNLNVKKLAENIDYILEKYPHVLLKLQTMHGFPTETKEEALMTLDFLKNRKWMHLAYVHVLKIFPNTDMEKIALENGISPEAIAQSDKLAYHELPQTLPFEKEFSLNYQTQYLNDYLLSRERLLDILPKQMKVFSEDEMVKKYDSILPARINTFSDLLEFAVIKEDELESRDFLDEHYMEVPNLNDKLKKYFPVKKPLKNALRVLLLDLSIFFSAGTDMLYDIVVPPMGLMYVMTYLQHQLGNKINGKIAKARVDFDSYDELKALLAEFEPDVIGIRSMAFYKDFFHKTVSLTRQWGMDGPIITGGPYATSDYASVLQDMNVDLVVLGEGEVTFAAVIEEIIKNNKKLPDEEVLKGIAGLAFIPQSKKSGKTLAREVILLDQLSGPLSEGPSENLQYNKRANDLAYVIFTSGSTGQPKGVMIEHRSLVNLSTWHNARYSVTASDRAAKFARLGFDASVWELYPYLIVGAPIYMLKDEMKYDVEQLNNYYERNNISIAFLPTQICEKFVKLENRSLRILLTGGDKLNYYLKKNYQLVNNYGPTENTVVTTCFSVNKDHANIPIGQPISNTSVYILDQNNHLQPLGVAGELCISGDGLARGYLNSPQLTVEKFVENPYKPGTRMYRSGDLTRWLADGNIEFLGRMDNQVKIRGCRLELGEIEKHLLSHDEIDEVAVVAQKRTTGPGNEPGDERDKDLYAYIAAKKKLPAAELIEFLSKKLPHYMLPSYFVPLDHIPLTSSGKVDRKALPQPVMGKTKDTYIAPRNEVEKKLAEMWAEVLEIDIDEIGIHSNFFDLGGHSLTSTILVSRISNGFNILFPVKLLFLNQILSSLAEQIKRMEPKPASSFKGTGGAKPEEPGKKTPESPYYKMEPKPLITLFSLGKIEPVDAAVIGYLNDILLKATNLTPTQIANDYLDNMPLLKSIYDTPEGRLAGIWLPLFGFELYKDKDRVINLVTDAIGMARSLGARVVSLAGSIPSATDYGRAIISAQTPGKNSLKITTGHDTTVATVVLSIKKILEESQRDIVKETVGFLGVGSIGKATLQLMLKCLPPPREIILCDIYKNTPLVEKFKQDLINQYGFQGNIRIKESRPEVPGEFYEASLIVGTSNIPEILDINRVKPGTLMVDDANCFVVEQAIKRFNENNDILFTFGGFLKTPRPFSLLDYVPKSLEAELSQVFNPHHIVSCAFSSLLCAKHEAFSPCIGDVDINSSYQHYQKIIQLKYQAPDLSYLDYKLDKKKILSFCQHFGGTV